MTPIPVVEFIPTPKAKTIYDLSEDILAKMAAKMFLLGSLAWDYADTCCNITASMNLPQTKSLSRAVRGLQREYDRYRNRTVRDTDIDKESELGQLFESICEQDLAKLNYGIASDKMVAGLDTDYVYLVKAVQMTMVILDTMKLYAAQCDRWIESQGVKGHSILPDHFTRLGVLIPQFAGDCYNPVLEARRITARVLLGEINRISVFNNDNEL